ncbi:MAG: hypothetical protein JWP16_1591 [Alphaproteobacteria bacterium]|nr:hypothetical protein [Alphaproteobacteria bacterium]
MMLRGFAALLTAMTLTASMAAPAHAQIPASYQIVGGDQNGIEIRFRGIPLRGVHADDAQNALSLDFQTAIDGAPFDRLAGEIPQWVSMAYANFDNGVIRSPRPVTFLTRAEPDGFSLRIQARGPMNGPPMQGPPPMRGQYPEQVAQQPYPQPQNPYPQPQYPPQNYVPPAQAAGFHTYGEYAALRNYEAQELSLRRADPLWGFAYGRAAMQSDGSISLGSDTSWYHGGDRMTATKLNAKLTIADGLALVGDATWTNLLGKTVRLADGTIAARTNDDIFSGAAGFGFELGRDAELRLEATQGNDVTGGRFTLYAGTPVSFGYLKVAYHAVDLDTPSAIAYRADKDTVTAGYSQLFAYGFAASLSGDYVRYGVHGDADVARTAGWNANLRWQTDIGAGVLAGISYDGHGEYRMSNDTRAGAAPTPFVPLGIRDMENHAITATLSSDFGGGFWFSAYAGYVVDRYAADGLLAGMDLHYMPAPGVDIALGVRQSAASYTQGETGNQTTAGLNLTLGFGSPPQPSWVSNQL